MRSGTSSCKNGGLFCPALFWKNARRYWPLWALYTLVHIFSVALPLLIAGQETAWRSGLAEEYMQDIMRGAINMATPLGVIFGAAYAMALTSYLMNSRASQMLHALPVRREGLLATACVLGFFGFAVPLAAVGAAAVLVGAAWGVSLMGEVLLWLGVELLTAMLFFSFAVCCAMFTGHILALPIFYGILNMLAFGVTILLDGAVNVLLVGEDLSLINERAVRLLTPAWETAETLSVYYDYPDHAPVLSDGGEGVIYCLVLTAAFLAIAFAVYRRRQLERAGDLVTVGWVRPVFQHGLGVCVGLLLGLWSYSRFFSGGTPWTLVPLVAFWSGVGALAGRMLLKKTVKVLPGGWKAPVALALVMAALLSGIRLDAFGYQRWTPDPAAVEKVYLGDVSSLPWDMGSYAGVILSEPEEVAAVVDFHRALVSDLKLLEHSDKTGYSRDSWTRVNIDLTYHMTDGSVRERSWRSVPVTAQAMAQPDSYAARLQAILDRPSVARKLYMEKGADAGAEADTAEAVGGWLEDVNVPGMDPDLAQEGIDQPIEKFGHEYKLTAQEAGELWAAMRKDMDNGDLGRRYLLGSDAQRQNCYISKISISLHRSWLDEKGDKQAVDWSVEVTLQKSAKETLKTLKRMGYMDMLVEETAE